MQLVSDKKILYLIANYAQLDALENDEVLQKYLYLAEHRYQYDYHYEIWEVEKEEVWKSLVRLDLITQEQIDELNKKDIGLIVIFK